MSLVNEVHQISGHLDYSDIIPYFSVKTSNQRIRRTTSPMHEMSAKLAEKIQGEELIRFSNKCSKKYFLDYLTINQSEEILKSGSAIVLTQAESSSGSGVFLIENLKELKSLAKGVERSDFVLKRYIEGQTVNFQCYIHTDLKIFQPSLQLVDIKPSNDSLKFHYRGNIVLPSSAYSSFSALIFAKEAVRDTCKVLQAAGYRGPVGFDVLIGDKQVWILDINPRFQNSTAALNLLLQREGNAGVFRHAIDRNSIATTQEEKCRVTSKNPTNTKNERPGMLSLIINNNAKKRITKSVIPAEMRCMSTLHDSPTSFDMLSNTILDKSVGLGFPTLNTILSSNCDLGRIIIPVSSSDWSNAAKGIFCLDEFTKFILDASTKIEN